MKTFKTLLCIQCALIFHVLIAKTPGNNQVWEGIHAFYNYETERSIKILTKVREEYPENPTVHLTWAAARWLHSQANDPTEVTYQVLSDDLNRIIPVYESLVERFPESAVYELYLGSAIGFRARVSLGKKEWFKTLVDAYNGFRIIRKVAKENPDMVDAQLPIGIVEYYASLSPVIIRWAVELFGLEADREVGLLKIERAANEGEFSWIEAKSIISFLYLWVESAPEKALQHSKVLADRFPGNFYFNILYLESLIRTTQNEKALSLLKSLGNTLNILTPIQQNWYLGYLQYEWGLFYFNHNEFGHAMKAVDQAIHIYGAELDIILTNAWLLKGMLHDLNDERTEALNAYQQCIELDNYSKAVKLAKQYIEIPYKG